MFCNVQKNTIEYLIANDLIDENMKITSTEFGLKNQELTALAKDKYGVKAEGSLFTVQTSEAPILYPTGNREATRPSAAYAIINSKFFDALQTAHDVYQIANSEELKDGGAGKGEFYQTDSVSASRANDETINKMKEVAKQMGIDIQELGKYATSTGLTLTGVNGVADTLRNVVAIANGFENVALTEEIIHVATAGLEQVNPKVITEMISKIDRFKIYKQVYDEYSKKKAYQTTDGKPDIRKIKKEAVDKLLAEVVINKNEGTTEFPELRNEETRSTWMKWWESIKDFFKQMYKKSNVSVFEDVANLITENQIGKVSPNNIGDIFYQTAPESKEVNDWYDKMVIEDGKTQKFETPDDRYYEYDGVRTEKTLTQVVKEDSKFKNDLKGDLKLAAEQKMKWGFNVHNYLENYIPNALIDIDGYARPKAIDTIKIDTDLSPVVQEALQAFSKDLISSFKPGTRFLVERKMVDKLAKGMIGTTYDFMAIEPNEKTGVKVHLLDWKVIGIDTNKEDNVPWYNQGDWKKQMGGFTKMMYQYGLKPNQLGMARMVPFLGNYNYSIASDKKSPLRLDSVEIGSLTNIKETKAYLIPVAIEAESTGNPLVDSLVKSLSAYYDKLYIKSVGPKEQLGKNLYLNELNKAIRHLQINLNFEPLTAIGQTFLRSADKTFKTLEGVDYSKLNTETIESNLKELINLKNSAEKFTTLDTAFLSEFPKEGLSEDDKKVFKKIEEIAASTERMMDKITKLQGEFVVQFALKQRIVTEANKLSILDAEKEVGAFSKTLVEASKLSSKTIKLAANLIMNARSMQAMAVNEKINEYTPILLALEKEAEAKGKTAFELIGEKKGTLSLIQQIDPEFFKEIEEARVSGDKLFFLANMDVDAYKKLANELINNGIEKLNDTTFSTNTEDDAAKRDYAIKQLKDKFDIDRASFNGYNTYDFARLFKETMIKEGRYSKAYIEMSKSKAALDMWNYMTGLNKWAEQMGYLTSQGPSFFPLMEATILQRLAQSDNKLTESLDLFKDSFTVLANEEQSYSKLDKETGKIRREIPKLFTRVSENKSVDQLSQDLNKVLAMWTQALMQYQTNKSIEDTLLTIHAVEKAKGHIVVDEKTGAIQWESGAPKVDIRSNKTADLLQVIIDDAIYGLREDLNSLGSTLLNTSVSKLTKGDAETKEKRSLAVKKTLQNTNKLVQATAIGLKLAVGIPNYFGFHFQTFVNSGDMYRMREFEKNHAKVVIPGGLSTIEKGLIDLFIALNEDVASDKMRHIAYKEGYIKWLGAWTMNDIMMSTNRFPEKKLEITNAKTMNDNAIVIDDQIVNARQYIRAQDRETKYKMSQADRKALESTFNERVEKIKETNSLAKVAKIENDKVVIPGVSKEELARYRTKVVEYGRNLSGQMSPDNKADYRRDALLTSFMMFKNWITKQVSLRTLDVQKNAELEQWEYGRTRAFIKTWAHVGLTGIGKLVGIVQGTDAGLNALSEMLEIKKQEYFQKTGQELDITTEEFYDMMRKEIGNEFKELGVLFGLITLVLAAKAAKPPDDADAFTKNRYKYWAKITNKIADEMAFYYDPRSAESITKGSMFPALGLLAKAERAVVSLRNEGYGYATGNQKLMDKSHPLKNFLDMIPVPSQWDSEIMPLFFPEVSKEMGIRVSSQARQQ